jgi:Domain of unknown function (DUF5664)
MSTRTYNSGSDKAHHCIHGPETCAQCALILVPNKRPAYGAIADAIGNVDAANGRKFDNGKDDLLGVCYHPKALGKIAAVLDYGAKKYDRENWRKVPDLEPRYLKACLRHIFARVRGEKIDPESGLPHLAHAACSILFLLEIGD